MSDVGPDVLVIVDTAVSVPGVDGADGRDGRDIVIGGTVAEVSQLPSAGVQANEGYLVGTGPYELYLYLAPAEGQPPAWIGPVGVAGPIGPQGPAGGTGAVGPQGPPGVGIPSTVGVANGSFITYNEALNQAEWQPPIPGGTSGRVFTSGTPPVSPVEGDIWIPNDDTSTFSIGGGRVSFPMGSMIRPTPGPTLVTTEGAQSPAVLEVGLDFADGQDLAAQTPQIVVASFVGTASQVVLKWRSSATSGACRWGVRLMRLSANEVPTSEAWDAEVTVNAAPNGVANGIVSTTVPVSFANVVAGDQLLLRIARLGSHGSDTMTATARLVSVLMSWV